MTAPPRAAPPPAAATAKRLYYLDYLRAAVVALVFLHHTAITYGASGSWYYGDPGKALAPKAILTLFVAYNQSWFMGFLFFLSGYLSLPSYNRKGAKQYVADRLRRFGIPLLAYAVVISPATVWLSHLPVPGHQTLSQVFLGLHAFGFGVLWFVEALLAMDLLFVVWAHWLSRGALSIRFHRPFPSRWALLGLVAAIGAASFLVRLGSPVGTSYAGLNLCYFPSYVAMFGLGILAWRNRWLDAIPQTAYRWGRWAVGIGILTLPVIGAAALKGPGGPRVFAGGPHWQALTMALWEQVMLVGVTIVLLRWGQTRLNRAAPGWQRWAGASYLAYFLQPLVIVGLGVLFTAVSWPVLAKFVVVGPMAIAVIYAVSRSLLQWRPIRRVFG